MKKYVLSLALVGASLLGASKLKYQEFDGFKSPE
ncbi:TPA: ATP-binding protein, partial [Campylobacter coli]|nr:ATP-binding protein [Campylobacter coli]